ncbi:MAG: hypothetical protein QM778_17215 [Myxococcales bacterium]
MSTPPARILWRQSDAARRAGDPARAADGLRELLRREPAGPQAQLAAFTLGKLELDALDRPDLAAAHFRLVADVPNAPLAEHALVRLVEAEQRRGMRDEALRAARAYLERYPRGRFRGQMTFVLSEAP